MNPSSATLHDPKSGDAPLSEDRLAGAMRGVYAHRMGEVAQDEKAIASFWRDSNFEVKALEPVDDRRSQQPDLFLSLNGIPFAYCEIKTIQDHRIVTRILHQDRPVEERTEVSGVSPEERLASNLVTAIRQLKYVNSNHELFNLVVLVNRDPEAAPAKLTELFLKPAPKSPRSLKAKHEAWTVAAIQEFRHKVDFCLWMEPAADGKLIPVAYFAQDPSFIGKFEALSKLGLDKLIALQLAA
jgi:hypothetical protein